MEKLNRAERKKIAKVLIRSISKLCDAPCGKSSEDIDYTEATAKKAHSFLCILLAHKLGLLDDRTEKLIDISFKIGYYTVLADQTGVLPADYVDEILELYGEIENRSTVFLYRVLSHTSWEINELEDFYDLADMTDEEVALYIDMIPRLFAYIKAEEHNYLDNEEMKDLTDRLEKLGVDTGYYNEMCSCKILALSNPKIKKAVDFCKQNERFKSLPEYEEMESYLNIILLIRGYGCFDKIKDDGDMFYQLGTFYTDHFETVGVYHLVWETVILLVFAEWAAEDILKYICEKGEHEECLMKQE